ncbi:marine proteobacterial sortase target protein [Oleiagrimonas sp. MCCC 1A03011]|uniref:marine proteobacterial sortase target protein n=1 Tax=Oleiagrimonas sp. MCCC 1A03011 TaxID=1926883 RepID=UPI000DC3D687|nr:marine proteobacterial sortase target protein [Oleiagrimonas sp. MCCC 1A03011]RAP59693.1 marine proteobacterial sortase target protein [Oleiagrimonas sp. MCCC 1A03011]
MNDIARRSARRLDWRPPLVLLLLLLCTATLRAQQAPGSGELRLIDAGGVAHVQASLDTDVAYRVDGLVADVTVHQRFRNDGKDWMQGEYLLPLPDGAAVYAMTLHIGKRTVVGEIREKQAARKVFAQARASGRKAALVEADSGNLFRTAVTNVAPGEQVDVELHYWQRVDYRDGTFSLHFPLTYTPRYHMAKGAVSAAHDPGIAATQAFASAKSEPPLRTQIAVTLNPGVALARVVSPSHAIETSHHGATWNVQLRDPSVVPDRDFILRWTPQPQTQPNVASFVQTVGGAHYATLMVMPPQQQARTLPRELILVIDTSGSMQGASIRQARAALDLALKNLRPEDRFNVIEFNSDMKMLHPQAVQATPQAVQQARDWVAALNAGGGTEMAPALKAALDGHAPEGYVRQVVFATDGAVDNDAGLINIIDRDLGDSRLFPVGIGSAPNAGFLKQAAVHGRGSETLIPDLHEVGDAMRGLLARLGHPALRNLHIDWPHGAQAYPRALPDLYLGEPLLVTARLDAPGGRVQLHGQLADHAWTAPVSLDAARPARGLNRLWAQARIEHLEEQLRQGGDEDTLRPQIVKTALDAHLVSRYTSLVAVDRTPARDKPQALRDTRIPNVLPAGSAFAQTATSARVWMLLAALVLLLALATAWWQRREAEDA